MPIKQKIIEVNDYEGLQKTIDLLRELESQSVKDKPFVDFVIRNFGNSIDLLVTLESVHKFVNRNIEYTDDEYDETLISPRIMNQIKKGDCDDMSLYIKTVLTILGIKSYYLLLGKTFGNFSHIAVGVLTNDGWVYLDGTAKIFNDFPYARYNYYQVV